MALVVPSSEFELPHIGIVEARPSSIGSMSWFLDGRKKERWRNAHDCIRLFLREECNHDTLGVADYKAKVVGLTDAELDEIAESLLAACYARRVFDTPENSAIGKSGCETLVRTLEVAAESAAEKGKELAKSLQKSIAPVEHLRKFVLTDAERLQQIVYGHNDALRQTIDALERHRAFSVPVAKSPFADTLENFKAMNEAIAAPYRELAASLKSTRNIAFAGSLLVSGQMVESQAVMAQIADRYRSIANIADFTASDDLLGIMSEDYVSRLIERPGFFGAAVSGLEGMASEALTAEILNHYDEEPDTDSSEFNETLSGLHRIDEDDTPDSIVAAVQEVTQTLVAGQRQTSNANRIMIGLTCIACVLGTAHWIMPATDQVGVAQLEIIREEMAINQAETLAQMEDSIQNVRFLTGRRNLRVGPDIDSDLIVTLNPDQIVRVIDVEGNWARVLVLSYAGRQELEGWLRRDGLTAHPPM